MDLLSDLLDGAHAKGGLFNQTILDPPWALRIHDEAPLAIAAMVRGSGWIWFDDQEPCRLPEGSTAIIRGPEPYTVADAPGTVPSFEIVEGGACVALDGSDLHLDNDLAARTHGASFAGSTQIISGTYPLTGLVSGRLLGALPPLVVLSAEESGRGVVSLIVEEVTRDVPGQQAVLDRLLDLALLTALRAYFARSEARPPGWYRAQGDPIIGPALEALHADPAEPWSVDSLAARVGVSRATLARRFAELVGESPMAYLAEWRIALAADRLRTTDDTLESIARRTGYANAFALSVAFKRLMGVSPATVRQ